MSFSDVCSELKELHGSVRAGASADELDRFHARNSVLLPDDFKAAYLRMDDADGSTAPEKSWMRLWPLHEIVPAEDKLPSGAARDDGSGLFVFADYAIECVYYVIDLRCGYESFGHVYALGATRVAEVAQSFTEFVQLVVADSDQLHSYS